MVYLRSEVLFIQDRMPEVIFNIAIVIKKCDLLIVRFQTARKVAGIFHQQQSPLTVTLSAHTSLCKTQLMIKFDRQVVNEGGLFNSLR